MGKSAQELYKSQFEARTKAWNILRKKNTFDLADIENLLKAENDVFIAVNNGRNDQVLQASLDLHSDSGRKAALKWFAQSKEMHEIANANLVKVSRMNKNVDPTKNFSDQIELLNRIISFLGNTD